MSNGRQNTVRNGASLGMLAGRATAVGIALYLVSFIYRSGQEWTAIALGGVVVLYALASIGRDLQYGYSPWEPVEWKFVPLDELGTSERQRALRWMVALKGLLVVGAVGTFVAVFAAGLETLGYVLLIGGLPAALVKLYQHYSNGTRPWYPSVPSQVEWEP